MTSERVTTVFLARRANVHKAPRHVVERLGQDMKCLRKEITLELRRSKTPKDLRGSPHPRRLRRFLCQQLRPPPVELRAQKHKKDTLQLPGRFRILRHLDRQKGGSYDPNAVGSPWDDLDIRWVALQPQRGLNGSVGVALCYRARTCTCRSFLLLVVSKGLFFESRIALIPGGSQPGK